jgi:hypothetical protein
VLTAAPAVDVPIRKEILVAVANLINAEEHLVYSLPKVPDRHVEELKQLVADIRSVRSTLMRAIGYGREGGELWCAVKHVLAASYRVLEAAEKASKKPAASELAGSDAVEMAALSQELLEDALVLLEIQKEMGAREGGGAQAQ